MCNGQDVCQLYLLIRHIALVSNQNLVHTLTGMLLDVGEPIADVCRASEQDGKKYGVSA